MVIDVLCPSRQNPKAALEALESFLDTAVLPETRFTVVLDSDEPMAEVYLSSLSGRHHDLIVVPHGETGNMNKALNYAALARLGSCDVLGFIGDDHRFRTKGWDRVIEAVIEENGNCLAYGNDLYMGDYLPTQVFISTPIVAALGWMGLPEARHLYLDNTWKALGEGADCLYYLPDVVIEHMHPVAGKAEWDENHRRVNTDEMYGHDRAVYERWLVSHSANDIEKVRALHA